MLPWTLDPVFKVKIQDSRGLDTIILLCIKNIFLEKELVGILLQTMYLLKLSMRFLLYVNHLPDLLVFILLLMIRGTCVKARYKLHLCYYGAYYRRVRSCYP